MDAVHVNWLAVAAAALATFLIGGLWYSPLLFSRAWMADNGFTEESLKGANMARIFGGSFVLALIAATNLAFFLGDKSDFTWGLTAGALVGLGWVATAYGTTYLFERKPLRLFLVNAGYHALAFTVMGGILGAWH